MASLLWKKKNLDIFNMVDFLKIFFVSRTIEVLIESNF